MRHRISDMHFGFTGWRSKLFGWVRPKRLRMWLMRRAPIDSKALIRHEEGQWHTVTFYRKDEGYVLRCPECAFALLSKDGVTALPTTVRGD